MLERLLCINYCVFELVTYYFLKYEFGNLLWSGTVHQPFHAYSRRPQLFDFPNYSPVPCEKRCITAKKYPCPILLGFAKVSVLPDIAWTFHKKGQTALTRSMSLHTHPPTPVLFRSGKQGLCKQFCEKCLRKSCVHLLSWLLCRYPTTMDIPEPYYSAGIIVCRKDPFLNLSIS